MPPKKTQPAAMSAATSPELRALEECARLYKIETSFKNGLGKRQQAPPESVMAALRALGAEIARPRDAAAAILRRTEADLTGPLPPAHVAWDGRARPLALRMPASRLARAIKLELVLEDGETRAWGAKPSDLKVMEDYRVGRAEWSARELKLPPDLPRGLHRLRVSFGSENLESLIISAPGRLDLEGKGLDRTWGAFIPTYALRTERDWGAGDFTDLSNLADWIAGMGGGVVATLPFMAAFLGERPHAYSPYSPASRLYWNEFYVDPERAPEFEVCAEARRLVRSAEFQREMRRLRETDQVQYAEVMALKRRALEPLARHFFEKAAPERREALAKLERDWPGLEDYARFRAVGERLNAPWSEWPTAMSDGKIGKDQFDPAARDYHIYVQLLADEQIAAMAAQARARGPGLYLDMPLGTHPDGYDAWREPGIFARTMNAGSPPDLFFPLGQNWGFPPGHPEAMRRAGYGYWIELLRRQFRHAGILRIDHVMGLHRLYWIPQGAAADQGVYVHYHAEDLYATLLLESARAGAVVVGEDLGTVPPYVRAMMKKRGLLRMYIMPWETNPKARPSVKPPAPDTIASLGNHDMPPFAAFVEGTDIPGRVEARVLAPGLAEGERAGRERLRAALGRDLKAAKLLDPKRQEIEGLMVGATMALAAGPARVALVNLEDLWLETRPQNTPGTGPELPNWKNKSARTLEEAKADEGIASVLRAVDRARRSGAPRMKSYEII